MESVRRGDKKQEGRGRGGLEEEGVKRKKERGRIIERVKQMGSRRREVMGTGRDEGEEAMGGLWVWVGREHPTYKIQLKISNLQQASTFHIYWDSPFRATYPK